MAHERPDADPAGEPAPHPPGEEPDRTRPALPPDLLPDLPDDDLEGVETSMSRLMARAKGWLALVVAVALVLPFGGWLVDEFAFGSAGTEVERQLGADAELTDALLLVRSSDCVGRTSTGSAFAVELDGEAVVVTNRHVVEGARTIGLRALDGGPALRVASHRLAADADVAVLELADPDEVPPSLPAGDAAGPGDEVRVVGFPGGRPRITAGPVETATSVRLVLGLTIDPGASGSPVLDDRGEVVGQVHARTPDGRGIATPLTLLAEAATSAVPSAPCDRRRDEVTGTDAASVSAERSAHDRSSGSTG